MAYRFVTCPDTAHLELIQYDDTPLGMLIVGCSRLRGACAVDCPRTCAARLDRRASSLAHDDDEILSVGDLTSVDVLGMLRTT